MTAKIFVPKYTASPSTHREIFSKSYYIKTEIRLCLKFSSIDLEQQTDVRLLFQINRKMVNTISYRLIEQESENISLCVHTEKTIFPFPFTLNGI